MQTVDEEPLETIHLYVVREEAARPSLLPVFLALLTLSILLVVCTLSPSQQPEERKTIRIPAVFLPLQVFTASVQVIPTGIKTYPATTAHGELVLTNGSVIESTLPKGIIFTGKDGVEVVTEEAVFVPAGSADGYGFATVPSHALVSGKSGNIPAFDIDRIEGSSIYIRNLAAFHGGMDAYPVKVVIPQDRQNAMDAAMSLLTAQEASRHEFLAYPCNESVQEKNAIVRLSRSCQFVAYSVASYMKVISVRLAGTSLIVDVSFVPRPGIIEFK